MSFIKLNWGHYITIFYICFVAVLATALVASFGVDHSLVVDDYYAQDLAYQQRFEQKSNQLSKSSMTLKHDLNTETIVLQFEDATTAAGTVTFYRPSDKSMDFSKTIEDNTMVISTTDIPPGKWRIKIDWSSAGTPYYKEQEIFI